MLGDRQRRHLLPVRRDPRRRGPDHVPDSWHDVPSEDDDVATAAQAFFAYAFRLLYDADLAERAEAWFAEQGTAVNEIELGGTTIRLYNADETWRNLDIWGTWS